MDNTMLLTRIEAQRQVAVGQTKMKEMLKTGEMPSLLIGRRRYVRQIDLEAFVSARLEAAKVA